MTKYSDHTYLPIFFFYKKNHLCFIKTHFNSPTLSFKFIQLNLMLQLILQLIVQIFNFLKENF